VKSRATESYLELKFMLLLGVGQAEAEDFAGGSVNWNEAQITFNCSGPLSTDSGQNS
jgi:hypothetical protein